MDCLKIRQSGEHRRALHAVVRTCLGAMPISWQALLGVAALLTNAVG
eukprot:SAG31_NODE_42864_length_269_cov_1.494118_1_plen_46_part_01